MLVAAIVSVSGLSVDSVLAVDNEYFKQSNNIEFSSASAGKASSSFVYYSQNDARWKSELYGPNSEGVTIGDAGCGPTSLAMIIATLVNSSVSPVDVAAAGYENGSLLIGEGTVHAPLLEGALKKGWTFNQTPLTGSSIDEVMLFMQQSGGYVYMGGKGPAPFTEGGHIVVIRSVDIAAGTITIADPYRGEEDVYNKSVVDTYRTTTIGITK